MHHFYVPVEYNKAPFIAELIVEEYLNNNSDTTLRPYNVQRIKMSALPRGHMSALNKAAQASNIRLQADEITISDLFSLVKTYDKYLNSNIGRKSINELTKDELEFLESVAQKYYKEMGVMSPFFRRWFGDWREFDKSNVAVTKLFDSSKLPGKSVYNEDSKFDIFAGSLIKKETYTHSKNKKAIQ